jgi:Beta-propeller repeat
LLAIGAAALSRVDSPPNPASPAAVPTAAEPRALSARPAAAASGASKATQRRIRSAYGKLPLSFVPNAGQTNKQVRYYAQGADFSFFFTPARAVLSLRKGNRAQVLNLRFLGANPHARLVAEHPAHGTVSYLKGSDRSKWQTGLRTSRALVYHDLWPGIDMIFKGAGGGLTYEFMLRSGGRPSDIRLGYEGAKSLSLSKRGNLLIHTPLGTLRDRRPQSFQRIDGRRVRLPSRFALEPRAGSVGLVVPRYDPHYPLVIDPSLAYSTYLSGSNYEQAYATAVDGSGSAYVTGVTYSTDFPTTPGAFNTSRGANYDAFVTKLNPAGSGLAYSTYLGGSDVDSGEGIAVDSAGNAFVTGTTHSSDFPTIPGAFQTTLGCPGCYAAFVSKLNASGSGLAYSTYLGGSGGANGKRIVVDGVGSAYVTGGTSSRDFPTTPLAFQASYPGNGNAEQPFVSKLNAAGTGLAYSTYLGGAACDDVYDQSFAIAVDAAGSAYVTGRTSCTDFPTTPGAFQMTFGCTRTQNGGPCYEAFVTKLNASGSGLSYSTFLGGSSIGSGGGIALDAAGSAYVTGATRSTDFPTTPGAFQMSYPGNGNFEAFVSKLNAAGSTLAYSTYLGGSVPVLPGQAATFDGGKGIDVDGAGSAYVTGVAGSSHFPTTLGAFQTSYGGNEDGFVTKINPAGSALDYSTYVGGSNYDEGDGIAVDSGGGAYVVGYTLSSNFPTTPGAFQTGPNGGWDGYAAKFSFPSVPGGYPRPRGATPLRTPLVIAYQQCAPAGNTVHGPPLRFLSCSPPQQASSFLTVGTPDANGAGANATGSVFYNVRVNTPPSSNDVLIGVTTTDVRCRLPVSTTCGSTNGAAGPDYTGQLRATTSVRVTDRLNGAGANDPATGQDISFPVTVTCAATASTTSGSTCSVSTSANSVLPGVVQASGNRAIWQLGQMQVFDGGASGLDGSSDATLFEDQGVFVP